MAAIVSIINRHGLKIEMCHRVSYCYISHSFYFNSNSKQLYISNKMELYSYKNECGIHEHTRIERYLKEELA